MRTGLVSGNRTAQRILPRESKPRAAAQSSLLGRTVVWILLIFGVLLAVMKLLPVLL